MKIASVVIFAHVAFVAGLLYLHPQPIQPKPRKPVAVHTYTLQEEVPKVAQPKSLAAPPPPPAPKPKPVEPPKQKPVAKAKPQPKPEAKPKPASQNKTLPQPKQDIRREELARMMQQSLASLKSAPAEAKAAPEIQQIGALSCEALTFEAAYQDRLAAFLQNTLTLPERGDVKLSLTVNRSGGVKEVTVKSAASERNQKYVEETVPSLLLPPFEKNFKGESTHTFSVTLTSS